MKKYFIIKSILNNKALLGLATTIVVSAAVSATAGTVARNARKAVVDGVKAKYNRS